MNSSKVKNSLLRAGMAIICLAAVNTGKAEVLSAEQALARVQANANNTSKVRKIAKDQSLKLIRTLTDGGKPTVYVFSNPQSFMVLPADDLAPEILGYSTENSCESANTNPAFEWWIAEYGRQIQWLRENPGQQVVSDPERKVPGMTYIAPMVQTKWNQSSPFNDMCPTINNTHCVTGCGATALAQLMKYHNWPKQGTGALSYETDTEKLKLTMDFSQITFDWDNMANVYNESSSQIQRDAVAQLMYACGVAMYMDYGINDSGASAVDAGTALVNYFGYKEGVGYFSREYFQVAEWPQLVYNQLKEYGPLFYRGGSNTSGHLFICDGYVDDYYFHFNWGWGGTSDGYFLLDALNPGTHGIGGSTTGYNFQQGILANVRPDKDGQPQNFTPYMYGYYFIPASLTVGLGNRVTVQTGYYNGLSCPVTGSICLKLEYEDGTITYVTVANFTGLRANYGYSSLNIALPTTLKDGNYRLTPVITTDGGQTYHNIHMAPGGQLYNTFTVASGVATFASNNVRSISATDVNILSDIRLNTNFGLTFNVNNTGTTDYIGRVRAVLLNSSNQISGAGYYYPVYLEAGATTSIDYTSLLNSVQGGGLSTGSYRLCIVDYDNNVISDIKNVNVQAASSASLTISNFDLLGDKNDAHRDDLHFTFDVECSAGYFSDYLRIVIFPYIPGQTVYSVESFPSEVMYLSAGDRKSVHVVGDFSNTAQIGSTYFAKVYRGSSSASSAQVMFKVGNATAVDDIATDDAVIEREYYNINGVRVNRSDNLAPGLYIEVSRHADGTVTSRKISIR